MGVKKFSSFGRLTENSIVIEDKKEEVKSSESVSSTSPVVVGDKSKPKKKGGVIVAAELAVRNPSVDRTTHTVYLFNENKDFLDALSKITKGSMTDVLNNIMDKVREEIDESTKEKIALFKKMME